MKEVLTVAQQIQEAADRVAQDALDLKEKIRLLTLRVQELEEEDPTRQ